MVATVVNALTNITLANDNTNFVIWKRDGTGGTPSAITELDVFIQGTGACSVKVSNQGVALAYNISAGVDLSATGTHLYIWCNMLAGGLMKVRNSTTVPGLAIIVSSDTTLSTGSNYKMWAVDGSDTYPGGWVRYVIDLSKTASTTAGTLDLTSVKHIGMYCNTQPNVAKFDNLVIDRIDYTVGIGLRVYGTSTTDAGFSDILAADEGTVGNKYGIVTSKGGVIYVRGRIELGDDLGTNNTDFSAVDRLIVFENPVYYNASSVVSCVSSTFYRLDFKGNSTGTTAIQFGKKVGTGDTARGRNGVLIQSAGPNVTMDFDDGQVTNAKIYGTILRSINGGLSWGTNTAHELIGSTIDKCVQFDPTGGIVIRNTTFSGYSGTVGALLWNASIDIKNSNFLANTNASNAPAIQHTSAAGSPYGYDNLQFSGNDYDVNNTSGSVITVNKSNTANPSTYEGSTVTFVGSVPVKVTVKDQNNNPIQNAQTSVYLTDGTEIINTDTNASGEVNTSYSGSTPANVVIRVRKSSTGISRYENFSTTGTINSGTGLDTTVVLRLDNIVAS